MSTSKLQSRVSELLSTHLGQYTIREDYRPEWLHGLELDFYLEELRVGIEVQGRQHYEWVPHFHTTYEEFLALQDRDAHKAAICGRLGITLHCIYAEQEAVRVVESLCGVSFDAPLHPNAAKREMNQLYQEILKIPYIKRLRSHLRRLRRLQSETSSDEAKTNYETGVKRREKSVRNTLSQKGYSEDCIQWFLTSI